MSRRTHTWNAWQATITAELASGANSVSVAAIPAEFQAPMYLVVEPDQTGQKEWIRADTINGNTFENLTRNLDGSDGDLTHPINSGIRLVLAKQHLDDLFLDVGDLETADSDHIADASDPHAAAGYLVAADIAGKVDVAGDTMTGDLVLAGDPDADLKAATKKYVDDLVAAAAGQTILKSGGDSFVMTGSNQNFTPLDITIPAGWTTFYVEAYGYIDVFNGPAEVVCGGEVLDSANGSIYTAATTWADIGSNRDDRGWASTPNGGINLVNENQLLVDNIIRFRGFGRADTGGGTLTQGTVFKVSKVS